MLAFFDGSILEFAFLAEMLCRCDRIVQNKLVLQAVFRLYVLPPDRFDVAAAAMLSSRCYRCNSYHLSILGCRYRALLTYAVSELQFRLPV